MYRTMLLFTSFFFVTFFADSTARAFDIPTPKIETVIEKSEVIFVGRVVNIKEIKRDDHQTIAETKIKILHCSYGDVCRKNNVLTMQYISDTIEDGVLPLELVISREVLFSIQTRLQKGNFSFDSRLDSGLDFAFEIDVEDIMEHFQNKFLSDSESLKLTNLYWRKHSEWISRKGLNELVNMKGKT